MKGMGYTNPIRGMERRLSPDFAQREMRDPGLKGVHAGTSGLGSLHTMPHLRMGIPKLQSGGMNPVGEAYAASRPNLYNPDPMRRRILAALQFNARNPMLSATPGTAPLPYADGGEMDDSSAPYNPNAPYPQRAAADIRDYESRMAQYGQAEQAARSLARGMTGQDQSGRADMWHDLMQRDATAAMDIRHRLAALNAQTKKADGGLLDGPTGADPQDLMQPEDQQSEGDGDERQVVLEAMAALEGQAEDPEEALAHFIDTFGPRALKDLQMMVETKHRQTEPAQDEEDESEGEEGPAGGEEEEEDGPEDVESDDMGSMPQHAGSGSPDELAAAGGGLLDGPGTGQSDEIEATTPSGRPVLLSDGEYVIDAPTVAALGDGSTNAGARRLDALRKQIRQGAYGHDKQAKPMRKGGSAGIVLRLP